MNVEREGFLGNLAVQGAIHGHLPQLNPWSVRRLVFIKDLFLSVTSPNIYEVTPNCIKIRHFAFLAFKRDKRQNMYSVIKKFSPISVNKTN